MPGPSNVRSSNIEMMQSTFQFIFLLLPATYALSLIVKTCNRHLERPCICDEVCPTRIVNKEMCFLEGLFNVYR